MSEPSEIAESRPRAAAPQNIGPQKILIVRLGAMGDVIHALTAAMALKSSFPQTKFGWVIEKRWSELLAWKLGESHFPDVIHTVDTRRWRKNLLSYETRKEFFGAIRELRAQQYDFVIDFQGAMKSALVAAMSGAPKRYGFADPWEKPAALLYTNPIRTEARHVVSQNIELALSVASKEGQSIKGGVFVEFTLADATLEAWAEHHINQLQLGRRFAILNPGAGWGAKQWPAERYAEVARALGAEGVRSLVNYGPGEEELARRVEQNSDGHAVAASFTISQLMAITRKAALFVGGDTGPMHLAAFLSVPVIAIFGPTDPARNGPYGTKSIVLRDPASVTSYKRVRETEAGLLNITAQEVIQAARELLKDDREGVRA